MCPTFRELVGADSVCLQTCVVVYLFSRSLCDFLGFEGHFKNISVAFFLHFEGWVAKWDPGPKNIQKRTPKAKKSVVKKRPKRCLFVVDFAAIF